MQKKSLTSAKKAAKKAPKKEAKRLKTGGVQGKQLSSMKSGAIRWIEVI